MHNSIHLWNFAELLDDFSWMFFFFTSCHWLLIITNNWHICRMQTSHAIATALNVIQTSHSFGDLMLVTKASQSRQVCVSCLIFTTITIHLVYRCLLWSLHLFFKEQCWKVDDYRLNIDLFLQMNFKFEMHS